MSHAAGIPEGDEQRDHTEQSDGHGSAHPETGGYPQPPAPGYEQPTTGGYEQPQTGGYAHTSANTGPGLGAGAGTGGADTPPPGTPGVYEGPLSGAPVSASDQKLWAMLAQLSVIAGVVLGMGVLGWIGPLIIFLVYKDRDRFIRFHAAEALNMAIAVVIVDVILSVLFTVFTIVTLGILSPLFTLLAVPGLVHVVFAIIGGLKANELKWWPYPVNIRLVK